MDQDVKLGRIAGVPVGANWSILLILVLLVWELSDLILPSYVPHATSAQYWVVGTASAVIFMASLLAHEVSHAVMALHEGVRVRGITLWLFGGVSELESEALSPGADFRIAVVGPLTSFVLAGLFGLLAWIAHPAGATSVVAAAAGWLAWTNVILGAFNLLPAAPLDGGRVLRAALWHHRHERESAEASATRAGVALGFFLITLGVLDFIAGTVFGLWLVFMGWFLVQAARAEATSSTLRSALGGVRVRDVMTPNPVRFSETMTVAELLDSQLAHHRFSTYPLVGPDGHLAGLTTLSRLRLVEPARRAQTLLIDVALAPEQIPVVTPEEPVVALLTRMGTGPGTRALVTEAGQLVGIVSPSDVMRFVQLSLVRRARPN